MASTWNRMKRMIGIVIPTSAAMLAIGAGTAWGTEACPTYASATCNNVCYRVDGSDTLTEVIQNAIHFSGACINYHNIGSGQAEKNMAGLSGATVSQGIGPMSRNFVPAVKDLPGFAPSEKNVLALDAGVMAVANIPGYCPDVTTPLADPLNPTLAQITTDLSIVLSGYPKNGIGTKSTGTTKECAHPQRLAALDRLTQCMGVSRVDHIYRRDDKSGTQDTFREHLQFDYWCNGKSEGNNGAPGSNLKNLDLDPIRRPCISADGTKAATSCTFYPLKDQCTAGQTKVDPTYGTIKCTQGLIVALSENDPGSKDITISIGNRIAQDLNGYTIGFAGLAAVDLDSKLTIGSTINTVSFETNNIRAQQYMFARRLFLQKNTNYVDPIAELGRKAEEDKLFTWATTRCNLVNAQPNPPGNPVIIMKDAGFVAPLMQCTDSCTDPQNMTCLTADAGASTPKQNIGPEITTISNGNQYPCVADAVVLNPPTGSTVDCPLIPITDNTYECNVSAKCTSTYCGIDSSGLTGICKNPPPI
jgi:ABC-type phosphate transport system substrate-binding protein